MPAKEHLTLSRATYALKDVAQLAGLEMDVLLERHVREGDLDLYLKVPAGYAVYSLIRNYLEMQPPSIVPYPHLVTPLKQPEIEAVRLSHRDCIALAMFRRIEQYCFPAGLAVKSGESSHPCEQDEFEEVLLRDWNFYPGQFEASDYQFGYGAQLSEQSLDAIRKGVTFRLSPDHVEGGGPSDFCLLGRGGGRLRQSYEYWFGIYLNPPAPAPFAERSTGISVPSTMSISEEDVFVTREDAKRLLEKFAKQVVEVDVEVDSQKTIIEKLEGLVDKHDVVLESLTAIAGRHGAVVESGESAVGKHAVVVDVLQALTKRHEATIESGESTVQRQSIFAESLDAIASGHRDLIGKGAEIVRQHEGLVEAMDGLTKKHQITIDNGAAVVEKHGSMMEALESPIKRKEVVAESQMSTFGVEESSGRVALSSKKGLPKEVEAYKYPSVIQESEYGCFRAVPPEDSPEMLKILFSVREKTWAVDWKNTIKRGSLDIPGKRNDVIRLLRDEAAKIGIEISQKKAKDISYFVEPVWARSVITPRKEKWLGTYEAPEFLSLVSAAFRLKDRHGENFGSLRNEDIDEELLVEDPVAIAEGTVN